MPSSAEIADFNPKNFACWVKISADDILKYFSYFFLQGKIWHFMQIISSEDCLLKVSDPISYEKYRLVEFYHSVKC